MTVLLLFVVYILLPIIASQSNLAVLQPQVYTDAMVNDTSTFFQFKYDNTKANSATVSNIKYNFGIVFYDQVNYTAALSLVFSLYTSHSGEEIQVNGTDYTTDTSPMVLNIRYTPRSAIYYLNLTFNSTYFQDPVRFAVVANEDDLHVQSMIFRTDVKMVLAKEIFQGTYTMNYHQWHTYQIRVNTSTYLRLKYSKCIGDISAHIYNNLSNSISGINPLNTISPVTIDGSSNFSSGNLPPFDSAFMNYENFFL